MNHKIGITEVGDAGLDFSWVNSNYPINIIITKHLTKNNNKFIDELVKEERMNLKMITNSTLKEFIHNLKSSEESVFIAEDENENEHFVTGILISGQPHLTIDGTIVEEDDIYELLVL